MLRSLKLQGVGPAKQMAVEFGDRLNLITGDNGLGKSFLLDIAWWALTRGWPQPEAPVTPRNDSNSARIDTVVMGKAGGLVPLSIPFDYSQQSWMLPTGRPHMPGLVIYAQVDGGFSVWDPARNYWKTPEGQKQEPYLFDSRQVWTGIENAGQWRCNGLYRDWASWQRENNESFQQLSRVIEQLSPPGEPLRPGGLQRVSPTDSQDYPSIQMPYGLAVPVIHASAAIRRILALAYLLIWSWHEHLLAAGFRREEPTHRIIFIVDEIEAHLHPSWQRRILPSLLTVVNGLTGGSGNPDIQVIATTHSPLVCVSMEPSFDPDRDRLLDMDLDEANGVRIEAVSFSKLGSGERWLLSRNFDMPSSRSEPAENCIGEAGRLVQHDLEQPGSVTKERFDEVHRKLAEALPDTDSFWVVWRRLGEARGWIE